MQKMNNKLFTQNFGLITDYKAEAFHYMLKHNKDYVDVVNKRLKLGPNVQGRDESAIKKTVTAYIKLIHPAGDPTEQEFNELVEFALEGRRRVKEQMNKKKPDDEFALIDLSYFTSDGKEVIVYCPESKFAKATQNPRKTETTHEENYGGDSFHREEDTQKNRNQDKPLVEKRIKVLYGDTGYSYETLFKDYLIGASEITIEDTFIRQKHQINNFLRLCEIIVKAGNCKKLTLITGADDVEQKKTNTLLFDQIADNLYDYEIDFRFEFSEVLHDREIKLNNGWNIKMGRGLDYFQSLAGNYFQIGTYDLDLSPCLETNFDFYKVK